MKAILSLAVLLASSSPAFAELPPLAHSLREIATIAGSPVVAKRFSSADSVNLIQRTDDGYTVFAGLCSVNVRVIALPSDVVGPAPLHLEVSEATCQPRD